MSIEHGLPEHAENEKCPKCGDTYIGHCDKHDRGLMCTACWYKWWSPNEETFDEAMSRINEKIGIRTTSYEHKKRQILEFLKHIPKEHQITILEQVIKELKD